jgi:diguanylate cyclase (GGDEF)-like protein
MTRSVRVWWAVLGVLAAAQLLLPTGPVTDGLYLVIGVCAGVATWWSRHRTVGPQRTPQLILLLGIVTWVLGDAAWAINGHIEGGEPFPAATDAFYLGGYVLFTCAVFASARLRGSHVDKDAVIDGLILGTVVALVLYVAFVAPVWSELGAVSLERALTIVYLVFDVLIVVQAFYLSRVVRRDRRGVVLLGLAFVAVFVGDVQQTVALRFPEAAPAAHLVHSWWLVAYLLLGAAALHGAPAHEALDPDDERRQIDARQITALGLALAVVPAVPAVESAMGAPVSGTATVLAAAVIIVLVCLRLAVAAGRMRDQAARLQLAARTDALTGLSTSRHFDAVLSARARERDGRPFLVLLVALDRLTEISDTLGYRIGDSLLRAAACRVRAEVGDLGAAARLAGDAFAVVVDDPATDPLTWAARLRGMLTMPFTLADVVVTVDAIVGVAVGGGDEADGAELLQRADVALSVARGRPDGVARYTGRMGAGELLAPHLMSDLSRALDDGDIVVHYQPQVDLATGQVPGVEALVRWQHPVHGLLAPAAFVPAAERTGQIRALTLYTLERALAQAARWRAAGTPRRVAVNLSVRDLFDPTFAGHVAGLIDRYEVPEHGLELEITESMALVDPARAVEVLRALTRLGVVLSVDDFGTGFSSLAHLQRLPVHRLKIDRSFVARLHDDEASAAIVRSTIDLGRSLGMSVVAEGVEDDPTLLSLVEMGCDVAQGFGLGRPVPADELEASVAAIVRRVPAMLGVGVPLPEGAR